jgi:polyhydroxybutyrate depolymerase
LSKSTLLKKKKKKYTKNLMAEHRLSGVFMRGRRLSYLVAAVSLFFFFFGSGCVGSRGFAQSGPPDKESNLEYGGHTRKYYVHLPPNYSAKNFVPLVLMLHGGHGKAANMNRFTNFNAASDRAGMIVVYPQSQGPNWNDGRHETANDADDVGFLKTLLERLQKDYKIETRKIFASGISNGGLMTYRLACEMSKTFAGYAAVAANLGKDLRQWCSPSGPARFLIITGDKDPMMPYAGGKISGPFGGQRLGEVLSSDETVKFWTERNGCPSGSVSKNEVGQDPNTNTSVTKENFAGCLGSKEVIRFVVHGGGHGWPGGAQYLGERWIGKVSHALDAGQEIVSFFSAR